MTSSYLLSSGQFNLSEIMRRAHARARAEQVREQDPRRAADCRRWGMPLTMSTFKQLLASALRREWQAAKDARLATLPPVIMHASFYASVATDGRMQVAA